MIRRVNSGGKVVLLAQRQAVVAGREARGSTPSILATAGHRTGAGPRTTVHPTMLRGNYRSVSGNEPAPLSSGAYTGFLFSVDLLLDAFARVPRRYLCRLEIVGDG